MKTIQELAKEDNFKLKYEQITTDNIKLFVLTNLNPDFIKTVSKDEEYLDMFLTKILLKRIKAFGLENKVSEETLFMYIAFNINNPAKAVLFLITLVEFYEVNKRVASVEDLSINIFPNGFYDDNTSIYIIDNYLKPRKTLCSEIYVSQ